MSESPKAGAGALHLTDFIPGVEPYDVATVVELQPTADGVRMTLTFDAMHNDEWTERAVMGLEDRVGQGGRADGGSHDGGTIVSDRPASHGLARSVGAVAAGFVATALLSLGTDVRSSLIVRDGAGPRLKPSNRPVGE